MSRNTKTRRLARKSRAASVKQARAIKAAEEAAQPKRPLAPEEWERVLSRFRDMRGRSVRMGFSVERGFWCGPRDRKAERGEDEAARQKRLASAGEGRELAPSNASE
jgi:hypothetical protein